MKIRLMIMMFLQFFVWGSWYVTGGNYMASHGMGELIYLAYLVSPVGSIVAPFFTGMIADRFFSVQKVMGTLHLLSGAFVFLAPWLGVDSPMLFLVFLLFHMLCYMPTVGLASATAFHLVKDKQADFPVVRLFGTLGWIGAVYFVSHVMHADFGALPMYVAGIGGIATGFYCFTLPNVPPPGAGGSISFRDIIGLDAIKKLKSRSFLVFIAGLFLISIPFASYFSYVPVFLNTAGVSDPAFKMSFGNISELACLLLMPFLFRRLGIKGVLIVGLISWALRYALFAFGAEGAVIWMLITGIAVHGLCYDFVYVASQLYMDKKATPDIRAQAQGFFVLISYGVGQGVGTLFFGWLYNYIKNGADKLTLAQWKIFWTVPMIFAVVVVLMFAFGFKDDAKQPDVKEA